MKRTLFSLLAVAGLCLIFPIACRDYSGDMETSHPLYMRAMQAKSGKNYAEAAKAFEEFLTIQPKSAKAHYELACIYSDNLQNFPFAIYHFNKYIAYSKLNREDQEQIRRYISYCREAENKLFRSEHGDAASPASLSLGTEASKLMAARAELNALNAKFRKLCAAHPEVRDYWRALDGDTSVPQQQASAASNSRSAPAPRQTPAVSAQYPASAQTVGASEISPTQPARTASAPAVVPLPDPRSTQAQTPRNADRIYTVQSGDTLQKLALRFYGSRTKTGAIRAANNLTSDTIRIGQKLRIPSSASGGRR